MTIYKKSHFSKPTKPHYTTCTVANALNVTFFGYSGCVELLFVIAFEPRVLITGLSGGRGFGDNNPADVAKSLIFSVIFDPVDGLFGDAITCGNTADGVMYLKRSRKQSEMIR